MREKEIVVVIYFHKDRYNTAGSSPVYASTKHLPATPEVTLHV